MSNDKKKRKKPEDRKEFGETDEDFGQAPGFQLPPEDLPEDLPPEGAPEPSGFDAETLEPEQAYRDDSTPMAGDDPDAWGADDGSEDPSMTQVINDPAIPPPELKPDPAMDTNAQADDAIETAEEIPDLNSILGEGDPFADADSDAEPTDDDPAMSQAGGVRAILPQTRVSGDKDKTPRAPSPPALRPLGPNAPQPTDTPQTVDNYLAAHDDFAGPVEGGETEIHKRDTERDPVSPDSVHLDTPTGGVERDARRMPGPRRDTEVVSPGAPPPEDASTGAVYEQAHDDEPAQAETERDPYVLMSDTGSAENVGSDTSPEIPTVPPPGEDEDITDAEPVSDDAVELEDDAAPQAEDRTPFGTQRRPVQINHSQGMRGRTRTLAQRIAEDAQTREEGKKMGFFKTIGKGIGYITLAAAVGAAGVGAWKGVDYLTGGKEPAPAVANDDDQPINVQPNVTVDMNGANIQADNLHVQANRVQVEGQYDGQSSDGNQTQPAQPEQPEQPDGQDLPIPSFPEHPEQPGPGPEQPEQPGPEQPGPEQLGPGPEQPEQPGPEQPEPEQPPVSYVNVRATMQFASQNAYRAARGFINTYNAYLQERGKEPVSDEEALFIYWKMDQARGNGDGVVEPREVMAELAHQVENAREQLSNPGYDMTVTPVPTAPEDADGTNQAYDLALEFRIGIPTELRAQFNELRETYDSALLGGTLDQLRNVDRNDHLYFNENGVLNQEGLDQLRTDLEERVRTYGGN